MQLDPELAAGIKSYTLFSQPPPEGVSLVEYGRQQSAIVLAHWNDYYGERLPPDSEYDVRDETLPVEGGQIVLRCVIPKGAGAHKETYPVMVWYHCGGWMVGDRNIDDNHLRTISTDLKLVTVNVEYRLAPEHQFPTGFNDCYAALKWVAENAASMNVALEKGFLIGGDSAGGNLAAAVTLQARDDPFFNGRKVTGHFLREPVTVHPHEYQKKYKAELPSFIDNAEAPGLTNGKNCIEGYVGYGGPPSDVRVSPLLADSHAGLPPLFIQVMEFDPLRDEGVEYERLLREAGIKTKLVRNPGVVHGFHFTWPAIEAAVKLDRDEREGLRWLLSL